MCLIAIKPCAATLVESLLDSLEECVFFHLGGFAGGCTAEAG